MSQESHCIGSRDDMVGFVVGRMIVMLYALKPSGLFLLSCTRGYIIACAPASGGGTRCVAVIGYYVAVCSENLVYFSSSRHSCVCNILA